MRFSQIYLILFFLLLKTELFPQQVYFNCNSDTLRENLVIPCFDNRIKPGREILVCKYSGNIDSLIKYISVAHKSPIPLVDGKIKMCVWQPLSEPFWFFLDYSVELKWQELEHSSIIELSFAYADKLLLKKKSTSIFPYQAQTFYQEIINKSLIN